MNFGPHHVVERGQEMVTEIEGELLDGLHLNQQVKNEDTQRASSVNNKVNLTRIDMSVKGICLCLIIIPDKICKRPINLSIFSSQQHKMFTFAETRKTGFDSKWCLFQRLSSSVFLLCFLHLVDVHSPSHPSELGQGMDGILDGVSGDDVRVVSLKVIFARPERELDVSLQLDDGVAAPLSPDDQHLHCVFAVARSHKFHVLRAHTHTHKKPHAALDNSTGLVTRVISKLYLF